MPRLAFLVALALLSCAGRSGDPEGDALANEIEVPYVTAQLEAGLPDAPRLFVTGESIVYAPRLAEAEGAPAEPGPMIRLDPSRRADLASLPDVPLLVYVDRGVPVRRLAQTLEALPAAARLVVATASGPASIPLALGGPSCPDDTRPMPTEPSPPSECGMIVVWEVRERELVVTSDCPGHACETDVSADARWDGDDLVLPDGPDGLHPTVAACVSRFANEEPNTELLVTAGWGIDLQRFASVVAAMAALGSRRVLICTEHSAREAIAGVGRARDGIFVSDAPARGPVRGSVDPFPAPLPPFETVSEPRALAPSDAMTRWLHTRAPFPWGSDDALDAHYLRARDAAGRDLVVFWVLDADAVGITVLIDGVRAFDLGRARPESEADARAILGAALVLALPPAVLARGIAPGACRRPPVATGEDGPARRSLLAGLGCEDLVLYEATFDDSGRPVVAARPTSSVTR